MKTVLDINNFWSPSGGGVRRYHLQKMEYYKAQQSEFKLVFLMQDDHFETEEVSSTLTIEHVKAFKIPGKWWKYRFIFRSSQILPFIKKYEPSIIEVGSPYILPAAVRKAAVKYRELHSNINQDGKTGELKRGSRSEGDMVKLLGFWHADFPVTYIRRVFEQINGFLGKKLENIAWKYARHEFKDYAGIQVSCKEVMNRMSQRGLQNLHWIPLGVDISIFNPVHRDEKLVEELKAGEPDRLTMFFPHRLCEEKGLKLLLDAYPMICEKIGCEPALVFAGTGPHISLVRAAEKKWKHIRYIGFIKSEQEMARWCASCEMGFALSGWETFGLSILEGMASGQCLVGASTGAAAEHIKGSDGGVSIANRDANSLAQSVFDCACGTDGNGRARMQIMGANGRKYAEKFSWDECFKRQIELYEKLCK